MGIKTKKIVTGPDGQKGKKGKTNEQTTRQKNEKNGEEEKVKSQNCTKCPKEGQYVFLGGKKGKSNNTKRKGGTFGRTTCPKGDDQKGFQKGRRLVRSTQKKKKGPVA